MKRLICIIIFLLAASACQQKEQPTGPVQGGPIQGGPIQSSQDDMNLLREMTKKDPGNIEAWIRLGNALMDSRRFSEAIDAYQKALAINPKNVDVRVDMGTCYRNIRKPDLAIAEYRKALYIDPRHLNAHKNLGVTYADDLQDKAQAIKEFEKFLELAPNDPDAAQIRQVVQQLKTAKK